MTTTTAPDQGLTNGPAREIAVITPTTDPKYPGMTHGKLSEFTLLVTLKPGGADRIRELLKTGRPELQKAYALMGTVHNMRLVFFDNDTRAIAATVFDGEWDPYTEDFFTKMPHVFDALFGNTVEYPGSAAGVEAFKRWTRQVQITAVDFWTAHPNATAKEMGKALRAKSVMDQALDLAQS